MQNKDFQISVVIPTFNRKHDLLKAIESVLKQSFPVFEVLICDDGSKDGSMEAVMALFNPKVRWINCGVNGGPAVPRNTGIIESKGNWIAFLDSDDTWVETKIEKQIGLIRSKDYKMVCTNASRIINNENKGPYLDVFSNEFDLPHLLKQNSVICSSVLVEKEILMSTSLFPEDKHMVAIEDFALWMRLATKIKIGYLNELLVNYNDNASLSIRSNLQVDSWTVYDLIVKDFAAWLKRDKVSLSKQNRIELRSLKRRIKYRGGPSPIQQLKQKIKKILGR